MLHGRSDYNLGYPSGKGASPDLGDLGFESHLGWGGVGWVLCYVVKGRHLDLSFSIKKQSEYNLV